MSYERSPWILDDNRVLSLITEEEFKTLPAGTVLVCIDGTSAVVGHDKIDLDTRYGFLAYGFAA